MPVCHKRKLCFCHIPRTGGVSVSNALRMQVRDKHYPISFYRTNFPDYKVFTIIRDYEQRIRSTFGWKMPQGYKDENFDAFVNRMLAKRLDNIGLMVKPDEYFLDAQADYYLRFDHLQEDLDKMLIETGHEPVKLVPTNSFKNMTIKTAFQLAEIEKSKITKDFIPTLNGLSSPKIQHLLNNLCSVSDSYLEIGTYMGSTLTAALYNNNVKAYAVDNFCMKPRTRGHFFMNTKNLKFTFIEKDCFTIKPEEIPHKIGLYFFDGEHSYDAQKRALTHFIDFMQDEFIYVVDDWNNDPVKRGTYDAIKELGLEIMEEEERGEGNSKDREGWWCGIMAAKLKKP